MKGAGGPAGGGGGGAVGCRLRLRGSCHDQDAGASTARTRRRKIRVFNLLRKQDAGASTALTTRRSSSWPATALPLASGCVEPTRVRPWPLCCRYQGNTRLQGFATRAGGMGGRGGEKAEAQARVGSAAHVPAAATGPSPGDPDTSKLPGREARSPKLRPQRAAPQGGGLCRQRPQKVFDEPRLGQVKVSRN